MDWNSILGTVMNWVTGTALKIVIALVLLLIAFKIIKAIAKKQRKKLVENKRIDQTVGKALITAAEVAAKVLVVLALVGYLGIDTTALSAFVASLGVCVGLAVNGTLSNLAGGVMLLITRPFNNGDFIEACGYTGTVEEIRVVSTKVITLDNKVVYIPNGTLSTSGIVNYSEKEFRRVDFVFQIAGSSDIAKAKALIAEVCSKHELVLDQPEKPFVRVSGQNDGGIDITVRAWTKSENYWTVNFDVIEGVKAAFDANGIKVPAKQLDVQVKNA